ncbi:MAG: META domain-containing protein [Ilumatobacteraceae bacterium]
MDGILRPVLIIVIAAAGFFAILALAINLSSADGDITGDWTVEALVVEGDERPPGLGTELTASFTDGDVNGTAGCNNFFGTYEVDGDSLTIGPLASTEKFCEDPEGVMEQELAYLGLLAAAESYSVSGDLLSITVGEGIELAFQR